MAAVREAGAGTGREARGGGGGEQRRRRRARGVAYQSDGRNDGTVRIVKAHGVQGQRARITIVVVD